MQQFQFFNNSTIGVTKIYKFPKCNKTIRSMRNQFDIFKENFIFKGDSEAEHLITPLDSKNDSKIQQENYED